MLWDLSCKDWQERLRAGRSLVPSLPLDEIAATEAVKIFNSLRLPDVPGRPTLATASGDWFRDIVRALFGSIDKETGKRRVRELFLLVPKKNSKTTYCAALMMTALMLNKRPRGDFVFLAPTHEIAKGAFEQCIGMIEADHSENEDGYLRDAMDVQGHLKAITFYGAQGRPKVSSKNHDFKGRLRIQTFSEKIVTGGKTVAVMVDELHLLGKDPAAQRVIGQIRGNLQPKREAFLMFVTTQSDDLPAGAFLNELIAARMIRDGEVPGNIPVNMLPILYEFPDDLIVSEQWRDPANWPLVNPNVGKSVDIDQLKVDFEKAKIAGEGEVRRFASQHLNIQIGVALKSNAWQGARHWDKNGDSTLTLDLLLDRCDVVTIGLDGGGLSDLFGLCVLGREKSAGDLGKRRWLLWAHAWCHESTLLERQDIASRLRDLQAAGDLTIVETVGDDVFQIVEIIERIELLGLLPAKNAIGVDSFGYGGVIEELGVRGFNVKPGERTVGISQGWKLNGAIKDTERRLAGKRIVHCAQHLMTWCVSNARVDPKGNAISITKQVSGSAKIDPLMAMFDAAALMALNPESTTGALDAFLKNPIIGSPIGVS
jgi:phage terminase large subunit-like protein